MNSEKSYLNDEEKRIALEIARKTIEALVKKEKISSFEDLPPLFMEKRGAFVTIHKKGMLRGCIGYIEAIKTLGKTISEMAVAASTQDPRFPPVTEKELKEIDIEISVLTPLRKIKDIKEIEVGRHGILIRKGFYSGLLLPQVATEYGWNREAFLEHTSIKAGLPENAWKGDVEIYIFSAQVFGEKEKS
ncbi:MAG: AMMECR1 domain-containing protein [Candidatus Schekmanbacteria bacterium RIFCSPHIGHO2_02_FULL_38_11]|uniref:AMMECR1 domain-containing protein n=1 Tax=Candidatus Schekmanbacteria bacterium RIFCSPLOWO2_12_FULL_38_15 TaxID=1817883 RepID=A0A1F7SMV6_9BACT|nr:MAG: AMMECR1 domain-containing protein [Candidatus Schekmanbacteria bacterium RIFCSPLOWO2_02_FULL_38_14]OGL49012.1 MAG: AMMECR1 domain-containing protein [Candidatus Schekmanbacteria bacterium RIFCSPHIGHO2_02_FULL_38_11]OGL54544.1 MAG: AMMECR1 domain-containing protein [Candidatus Schekmanbacteria bacterium RIFCSPLOWO2_12_FULL_38_15]